MTHQPVFELKCRLQTYPWGKTGLDGLAAQLAHASQSHYFEFDQATQYAELWMGTHPNGEATLQDGTSLGQYLNNNRDFYLGGKVLERFGEGSTLPFLFKILTARKALQLQIHPDKSAAKMLHSRDPEHFKDSNHKPEIALAVTPCEIFAGFRPAEDINRMLDALPQLRRIFHVDSMDESMSKDDQAEVVRKMLRHAFNVKNSTEILHDMLAEDALLQFPQERGLLQRCHRMYPGDSGAFIVVFLMNFFLLQPGDAAYVKEDGIHAWFTGDMIECMAASDNVLNTGFLPESERQKEAFLKLVRYDNKPMADHYVEIQRYRGAKERRTLIYNPPIEEFCILRTELHCKGDTEVLSAIDGPGIVIVVTGSVELKYSRQGLNDATCTIGKGQVFFVAHSTELSYKSLTEGVHIFEAITGHYMDRRGDIGA
ncbi:Mannose-6-phosphate isomerase [Savitreella phatthalungensis]